MQPNCNNPGLAQYLRGVLESPPFDNSSTHAPCLRHCILRKR